MINKQSGLLFEKRLMEKHVQVSARPGYTPRSVRFAAKLQALKLVAGAQCRGNHGGRRRGQTPSRARRCRWTTWLL